MPDGAALPVLDHELADDELHWMRSVSADFSKARAAAGPEFNPKEALRAILARTEFRLSAAPASGPELARPRRRGGIPAKSRASHTHRQPHRSVPDVCHGRRGRLFHRRKRQAGVAPVVGGSHFHNAPGPPHAFVPKVGIPKPDNWEIAFIAITPRNLKEDTHRVSDEVRGLYKQVFGQDAPLGGV